MTEDFKDQIIFNLEKDNTFYNSKKFYKVVKEKYGKEQDSELYIKVLNYQIKKYGRVLTSSEFIEGTPKQSKNFKKRKACKDLAYRRYREMKVIERAEEHEREKMVHSGKTS